MGHDKITGLCPSKISVTYNKKDRRTVLDNGEKTREKRQLATCGLEPSLAGVGINGKIGKIRIRPADHTTA